MLLHTPVGILHAKFGMPRSKTVTCVENHNYSISSRRNAKAFYLNRAGVKIYNQVEEIPQAFYLNPEVSKEKRIFANPVVRIWQP